ncbi:hypothetical protein [Deinococcus sp. NW-56]|uniref:hypothetical protein n=1 Tax=Deinococcus sp. NW-56 TaxID=2080419 RepID=UPI000CF5012F|nr:hypothetical protein [Deinococcus sp. NW-56]
MLYLASTGSDIRSAPSTIGLMTGPGYRSLGSIKHGRPWASDCGVYSASGQEQYCPHEYATHLDRLDPYADTCLFVVVPDHPGDGPLTFQRFLDHAHHLIGRGFPLAYVLQDGAEHLPFPDGMGVAFLGGTDPWRARQGARMIRRAKEAGFPVHVGRVNSARRVRALASLGVDTVDGTYVGFRGLERGLSEIASWLAPEPLPTLLSA